MCHLYGCVVTKSHGAIKVWGIGGCFLSSLGIDGDIVTQNKAASGTSINRVVDTNYACIIAFDDIFATQNIGVCHFFKSGCVANCTFTNAIVSAYDIVTTAKKSAAWAEYCGIGIQMRCTVNIIAIT